MVPGGYQDALTRFPEAPGRRFQEVLRRLPGGFLKSPWLALDPAQLLWLSRIPSRFLNEIAVKVEALA